MRSIFRFIRDKRFSYAPLVEIEVSAGRLLKNMDAFAKRVTPWLLAPVLKANAYGHGLVETARVVERHDRTAFLVVDSYHEALILRNEGIEAPVVIMGYSLPENIAENALPDVSFTVTSLEHLRAITDALHARQAFHLKFDTGMHRQGIMLDDFDAVCALVRNNPYLEVDGICSHLADADGKDESFTHQQITAWNALAEKWAKLFPQTTYYHVSATAGMRFAYEINANVGRLGIGLYGFDPSGDLSGLLLPALRMKTLVTNLRRVKAGEPVGYNATWNAEKDMTIATVPVGYYEGVDRCLSNKGALSVAGITCPIVGRVSMNITTIDVTHVPGIEEGEEALVISDVPTDPNSVAGMANLCESIPYEILVHIPALLHRVVV